MNTQYNMEELVNILYRGGMDFELIKKLLKLKNIDTFKNNVPKIAKVSKKRGRGCILIIIFEDNSVREIDFYNLRTSDTDAEIVKLLNTRGYLAQFKHDEMSIFWDEVFSLSRFDIFRRGKIINDPTLHKLKQKTTAAKAGQ